MKARIALYSWTRYPDWTPLALAEGNTKPDFTQVTEVVEVDFPELSAQQVLDARVAALRRKREEALAEHAKNGEEANKRIADINKAIAELTAGSAAQA